MDLEGMKYVEDLHDPWKVFSLVVLLALLSFLVTALTTFRRRPGVSLAGKPQGRLAKLPLLKLVPRRGFLVLAAVPAACLVWFDAVVLDELLTLPYGSAVAIAPIVLGSLLGMLATTRPYPRPLMLASGVALVAVVIAAFLFSSQFATAGDGSGDDEQEVGQQPPPTATAPAKPSGTASAKPSATPSASSQPTTAAPARAYDPAHVDLPTGTFATTAICMNGQGTKPVGIKVTVEGVVDVRLAGGAVVQVDDVRDLRPCSQREGADPTLRRAPGDALELFDGSQLPLEGPVAVIATYRSDAGMRSLAWRGVDDVAYIGSFAPGQAGS